MLTPTLGAMPRIFLALSSGTYQSVGAWYMWLTSSWGPSAAYFSMVNSPQVLPITVTFAMSRSPACASGAPSLSWWGRTRR